MNLEEIAKKMCAKGQGILAADESTGTMDKRIKSVNLECTKKNRLNFRQALFSSNAMKSYIGGVILFASTIRGALLPGADLPLRALRWELDGQGARDQPGLGWLQRLCDGLGRERF